MLRIALYAGSFDPMTKGHVHIIERALKLFDRLIVAVAVNHDKKSLLTTAERVLLIQKIFKHVETLSVESCQGLTVELAKKRGATHLIRGIRTASDCDQELRLAGMNYELERGIDTLWIPTWGSLSLISATLVREIISVGGNVSSFVPPEVADYLAANISSIEKSS